MRKRVKLRNVWTLWKKKKKTPKKKNQQTSEYIFTRIYLIVIRKLLKIFRNLLKIFYRLLSIEPTWDSLENIYI